MRRYETIFILRSDLGETQVKDSIKRFEGLVATGGGEMLETDDHLAHITSDGCTDVQGYLISRPMPPEQIEDFLRSRNESRHHSESGSMAVLEQALAWKSRDLAAT